MNALTLEPAATTVTTRDPMPRDHFANLKGHQFMNLTTFRKNGQAVATPVWFALTAGRVYVVTSPASGKVKRIRHTPRVLLGPCTANGKPLGPTVAAEARLLPMSESTAAHRSLATKYGWQWRVIEWWWRMRRQEAVFLEIVPGAEEAA